MKAITDFINPTIVWGLALGFIISTIIGPLLIPVLHKLKFGQNIREEGPKSHMKKAGTPTIGGLIFIIGTTVAILIMYAMGEVKGEAIAVLLSFIGFGFVGFLDDLLKIIHRNNLGLRAWQKMVLLLIISGALSYYAYLTVGTKVHVPFTGIFLDYSFIYIPFVIVYFAGATNAVNLTDGLDGLATSITILVSTFFAIVSYSMGQESLSIFCVVLTGALLGFLRLNAFPARIFMGDTGSLALGGAVSTVALLLRMPWVLFIVGGIYVIETLSVILQVASFKIRKKRIFKMAPIHHHFEFYGWSEVKIVSVFSIITVILCFIGFLAI